MNDRIITDKVYTSDGGQLSTECSRHATGLVVALMAKGYQPDNVIGILADALSQAMVAFSPDAETAVKNMTATHEEALACVKTNFTNQKGLIDMIEERLGKLLPLAAAVDALRARVTAAGH